MKGRDLKITGLVLRKTNFRETSVILDVLTPDLGKIAVIAKGARNTKSDLVGNLDLLNEINFDLYVKAQSDWYLVKSADVIKTHLYEINFNTSLLMQAATEIIRQLHIPPEDYEQIYNLMHSFLYYIPQIKNNGIAIFWRFLLRLMIILGIELDTDRCVICNKPKKNYSAFSIQSHGLICSDCYRPSLAEAWSKPQEITFIMKNIMQIGNFLEDIKMNSLSIKQINKLFLDHLEEHFNKKFYLKSLQIYK